MKVKGIFIEESLKKNNNQKTKQNVIFQLRQFSINFSQTVYDEFVIYCIKFLLSKGRNQEGGLLLSKSETDNFLS